MLAGKKKMATESVSLKKARKNKKNAFEENGKTHHGCMRLENHVLEEIGKTMLIDDACYQISTR